MGRDGLTTAQFHIGEKAFVALQQHALRQGFKTQQGIARRGKASHGSSRDLPMVSCDAFTMRPVLGAEWRVHSRGSHWW